MYAPEQAQPEKFEINPQNHLIPSPNAPSYEMDQIQSIPVVTQQPSMYNILIKHTTKVSNARSSFIATIIMQSLVLGPNPTNMTCPTVFPHSVHARELLNNSRIRELFE